MVLASPKTKKVRLQKYPKQPPVSGDLLPETCPSFRRGHVPAIEDVERLRTLSLPHVESFDFFLETGLRKAIQDIVPSELDLVDPKAPDVDLDEVDTIQFWVENITIKSPTKSEATRGLPGKLTPRECRELGLMYSGQMIGDFCYQIFQRRNGVKINGRIVKLQKHFGNMPIMVMSQACHLKGKTPTELVKMKEEVSISGKSLLKMSIGSAVSNVHHSKTSLVATSWLTALNDVFVYCKSLAEITPQLFNVPTTGIVDPRIPT
jgi:DNA-directed RNA polymerase beta subunit